MIVWSSGESMSTVKNSAEPNISAYMRKPTTLLTLFTKVLATAKQSASENENIMSHTKPNETIPRFFTCMSN